MTKDRLQDVMNALGQASDLGGLRRTKAQYDPDSERVVLWFETEQHLMPAEFLQLRLRLEEQSGADLSLRVRQSAHAQVLLDNTDVLTQCVKDCCVLSEPLMLPFVNTACVGMQGDVVSIGIGTGDDAEFVSGMGIAEKVRTYLADSYELQVRVQVRTAEAELEEAYTPPECVIEMSEEEPEEAVPPQLVAPAPDPEPVPRRLASDVPAARVCDLTEGGRAAVDVQIVSMEERKSKDGQLTILNICATDYTASVSGILFLREGKPAPDPMPRTGDWVKLLGKYEKDSYSDSFVFKISDTEPSTHVDRADDAPEKRVELHAHTKMSAMDAVTGIKDLVKRAADWGHEAIAITDHGVTQAFPTAAAAAGNRIKLIYGVEAYMFDDTTSPWIAEREGSFDREYVVFDCETTGLSARNAEITEIGAARIAGGKIVDTFETFIRTENPVPASVTELTGITDEMLEDAPEPREALQAFHDFVGDAALVAHNASFDMGFLHTAAAKVGMTFTGDHLDTLLLARLVYPNLKSYTLSSLAAHLNLSLDAHRALNDAQCTARVLLDCFERLQEAGFSSLNDVESLLKPEALFRSAKTHHIILLCKNKQGMTDLNRLVSMSHIDYLNRKKPRMPRSAIAKLRENLILGSACESGDLYQAILSGQPQERIDSIARFYDYLEIQPVGNNRFMTRNGSLPDEESIRTINKEIVALGERLGIPVAATCDVHFLEPEDELFRRVLQSSMGYESAEQPPLFFRTTEEMLSEFGYLSPEKAYEVVINVPRAIASQVEQFELLPDETMMPVLDGASEAIETMAYENARKIYGDPLPDIVDGRLKRELGSIIGHGFSVLYYSAHKLVSKSNSDGYLVGSRGSVGSSLTATMTGITEVNPLPPHYVCPNCCHSDFDVDTSQYDCGVDLPDAVCPECGTPYKKDGFNIPFEVFLGIDADKVPDIDLNFSGEYQNRAHKYTEELFGKNQVFRAGTISGLKDKNAYGYVRHYADDTGQTINAAETTRLQKGLQGVKKTTGQHPGGMVIVPRGHEIYEYTAVQWPANEPGADFVTTHFDFRSMHDVLVKLDILGHDAPTIMRLVQDLTGVDPLDIPLADPEALRLFSSIEPLGIDPADLFGITKGTLGVPEFGTSFVRQMLQDTQPSTVAEIIRICGLSHGTGVWLGNAQELIRDGTCVLSEAICARDDIMNYLVARGVDKRKAFFIMENTRKGKVARGGFSDEESAMMEAAGVPEWFIAACRKIQYLFPKGHAVAYCLMALRIAYCKVHYKEAFYATYFDVNTDKFDATLVSDGLAGIRKAYENIQNKGNAASDNERQMATLLEVCAEMYLRGLQFLRVDLEKSDPVRFQIEPGGIRLPFVAVPQLGERVARAIAHERTVAPFLSIEDLKRRTKLSSSVADAMKKTGALAGLAGRDQLSLFDIR